MEVEVQFSHLGITNAWARDAFITTGLGVQFWLPIRSPLKRVCLITDPHMLSTDTSWARATHYLSVGMKSQLPTQFSLPPLQVGGTWENSL